MTRQWWLGAMVLAAVALIGFAFYFSRQIEYRSDRGEGSDTFPGPLITEPSAPPTSYEILTITSTTAASELSAISLSDGKRRILFTDRDEGLTIRYVKKAFDEGRTVLAALSKRGEQTVTVLGSISFSPAAKVTTLLTNFGTTEAPVASPDGARVAFLTFSNADPDYGYSLIIMNPDGSNKKRLVKKESLITSLAFNGSGSALAYLVETESGMAIETIDVSGSGSPQRLIDFPNEVIYDLFWGQELVFGKRPRATGEANRGEIYSLGEAGSGLRRLTTNEAFDGSPFLSPDGASLALVRTVFSSGQYTPAGEMSLMVINLAEGKETELGPADAVLGWRPVTAN